MTCNEEEKQENKDACPKCGSSDLIFYVLATYHDYKCRNCGHRFDGKDLVRKDNTFNSMTKNEKKAFISNGHLDWFISLYKEYCKTTDKPSFADFMAWLLN